jgi:O-antigen ligase
MEKNQRFAAVTEGFALLLFAAAFAFIQIIIGGTRMVFSLPAYAVLGIVGLLAIGLTRRRKPSPHQWCLAISAIFLGYILFRALLSPVPYIARSDVYSVLAGLVVYYFTACIFTDAKQRMIFVCFLLALAMAHSFVGAVQFRDASNYMPISWLKRYDYDRRASGFYICPNHLAGLLEVVGIMGLGIVCWSRWPVWLKMLVGYGTGICYVGLVLTGSRGGYISTVVSLVVFAILSLAILRRTEGGLFWKVGGAGLLAAILLSALTIYAVGRSSFLTSRAQQTFETTNMRVDLWKGALQQWKLQLIFGTGSGTFLYWGRFFRTDRVQLDPIYTHNDYLNLLAEYGLVGAVGVALFLAVHLWRGGQSFARLGPKRIALSQRVLSNALALNVGAIAAISSYLSHSIFDFNLHIPANLLLMAFVFGIVANDGIVRESESPRPTAKDSFWRLGLAALGLVLLVQSVRLLPGEYFSERARMAVRDQQPGLGIRYALDGLKYDPENPDLYFRLAGARSEFADEMADPAAAASFRNEAIRALEKARAIAPQDEVYALELASVLHASGRFLEAEWIYYEALQLDPRSTSLRRYYERHLELWRQEGSEKEKEPNQSS